MKVLGIGPFIGDLEAEMMIFRPYAAWLSKFVECDRIFISSHFDRAFLYHWLDADNFIPVNAILTLDTERQDGLTHKMIDHSQYLKLYRGFRNEIFNKSTDIQKDDIVLYNVPYTKGVDPITIFKKRFLPVKVETIDMYKNVLLFLDCRKIMTDCDIKTAIIDDAVKNLSSSYLVQLISSCKVVVCPLGLGTFIANLQHKPVISWDVSDLGKYRAGGIYNFGNKDAHITYCDEEHEHTLPRTIRNFIASIGE